MSDNVAVTAGVGTTIAADEVVDGTLGTVKVQYVKIMDGTLDGTTKAAVGANGLAVAVASGGIASGAVASGSIASGAFASGAVASGAIAAGAIAAGATSIAENEDVASADGDRGVKIMFKRLDTPANASGTDGDYEQPQMSAGRVWTSTVVTGTVAVTQSGTWDEVGINDSGNSITVDNGGTFAVQAACTNAGTFAVQVDGAALTALQLIDDWDNAASDGASVSGDTAHDTADAGEPVKVGAKATTALSGLTLVADADRTNLFAGVDGVQITRPHCNLEDITTGQAAITDGSSTSVISAQGAGVKTYITSVIIANTSATAVTVDLRDGTAGSVKATLPVPANTSGVVCNLPVPLPFSANTAVAADPSAAASTITVTLIGFKSKV